MSRRSEPARGTLSMLIQFICVAVALASQPAPAEAEKVGFEETRVSNGTESPLTVGIWYPTTAPAAVQRIGTFTQVVASRGPIAGRRLALVVISHGSGASYEAHYDTALALAHAGMVAAAVSHTGDTYDDESKVLELWRRPDQLHRLISYMLDEWHGHRHLSRNRVGAFGFSNGGFTVLVAAGGVPDLGRIASYCADNPHHDLCQSLKKAGISTDFGRGISSKVWTSDPRIKAAVIAAPGFGFAFTPSGLQGVRIPIQLWRAEDDRHQPDPFYDEAVRAALPRPPEYHVVAHAGHYDFLPPCSPRLAQIAAPICADPPGFDRAAFHEVLNGEIVRFFRTHL
jgi:predicted dienelactone hydrolase